MEKSLTRSLFVGILTGLFGLSIFSLSGCQNELISEPNMNQLTGSSAGGNTTLLAPTGLKASHGGYQSVTLTWVASKGAARYKIYSASSAFDTMEQVAETADSSTSFTLREDSGVSKYYCVSAISYDQKESTLSSKAFGSSLATPIITGIDCSEDGSEAKVSWWMDNCKSNTYLDRVCYEVFCFDEDRSTQVGHSITVTGATDSATFTGLSGKTVYYFRVHAYTISYPDDKYTEKSDMIDAETAHRLIPDAAVMFEASQGTNNTDIKLSWKLPSLVDYKASGVGGYERYPVFFKLERSEDGSKFDVIANYIGSILPLGTDLNDAASKGRYYFNCSADAENSSNISVTASTDEDAETNPEFPKYTSGSTITFVDNSKELERGKKYLYRIQSYVEKNEYTDKKAITEATGWEIGNLSFSANAEYHLSEENPNLYTNVVVSTKADFDSKDIPYSYYVKQTRTPFETSSNKDNTEKLISYESISEINSKKITYSDFVNEEGYYAYTLYVLPYGESDTNKAYISEPCTNSLIVTNDATATIEINTYTIEDGYAHKYVLNWEMDNIDSCKFSLKYRENNVDSDFELIHPAITGSKASYEVLDVPSNSKRIYTLRAYNGFEKEISFRPAYTLGLPEPEFDLNNIEYDSIAVQWKDVQNGFDSTDKKLPVSYQVSAKYEGEDTELCNSDPDAEGYTVITSEEGVNTCKITKPAGWNNPAISGKKIIFSVKAISDDRNESDSDKSSCTSDTSVCTLGPALCNTKITDVNDERINIKWNKVTGAKLYLIYRVRYTDGSASTIDSGATTYYVVNTEDNTIVETNDSQIKVDKLGSDQTSYTLGDLHFEFDDASDAYSDAQQKLGWGLPFGYIVLPVKNDKDFSFEGGSTTVIYDDSANSSKVNYGDMKSAVAIGATYGFGLNVTAAKAENSATVKVSWEAPYPNKKTAPFVFRRQKGSKDWKLISSLDSGVTEYNDNLAGCDKTKSYFYAVQYGTSLGSINTETKSYFTNLDTTKDERYNDGIKSETLNKGYLFYLGIGADYNGTVGEDGNYIKDDGLYYSEKFTHTKWDFEERARGPQGFTVYAKNLNTTFDYVKLADVSINNETEEESYVLNATNNVLKGDYSSGSGDTHISENSGKLILKPIGITAGTATDTNGILKILRSSKTYFMASMTRSFTVDGKSITVDHNPEVYAYRMFTDAEYSKSIGLIIADALYKAGIPAAEGVVFSAEVTSRKITGGKGALEVYHTAWQKRFQWGFTGVYRHIFVNGCSSKNSNLYDSDFSITSDMSENLIGSDGHKVWYLAPINLRVTHDSGIQNLNSTVYFTAGTEGTSKNWSLTILKDNSSIVSVSNNETEFLNFFPYNMGSAHKNGDSSLNTNLPTYKGSWWN